MAKRKVNHKWHRVVRTSMPDWQKKRQDRNKELLSSDIFKKSCGKCGIEPTKRQASKFNNKKGILFKSGLMIGI